MKRGLVSAMGVSLLLAACGGAATSAPANSSAPAAAPAAASKPASASQAAPASAAPASKPAAAASAAAASAAGGAKDKLTIGYTSFTLDQEAPMVAKEEGIFDKYGIDATVISTPVGAHPEAAMVSGQLQAYQAGPEMILADLGGNLDMQFTAAADKSFLFWLYSVPEVKTAADLKGKAIAVTSLTSSTYTSAKLAVKSLGLDPDKDVRFTPVGNPPAILAAMQNGAAQAGAIGTTNIIQVRAKTKFNMLVDVASLHVPYPAGWLAVSKQWASTHQDLMRRLMKAYVEGIAYELQNAEGTKKVLSKYSKNEDPAFLNGIYELVTPHIQKVPYADVQGAKLALDGLADSQPKVKTADPNTFLDNHWVKELDDSGFVNSLYK